MRIGYACKVIGVIDTDIKSCVMKNATKERLHELISYNLDSLERMIDYNIKNNILHFRISSDIIPFGSSPINEIVWWNEFSNQFDRIGTKIANASMRVSMHPGQYTVLNSPNKEVVVHSIEEDLNYHARFLKCLKVGSESKLILHLGGVYGDKKLAKQRFIENYLQLDEEVKKRLVLENDDVSYHIEDILEVANKASIPVVYDNLHNKVNPSNQSVKDIDWIMACQKTWKQSDGIPKMHYAQQDEEKKPGAHSKTIQIEEFLDFYSQIQELNLDIMLEVKDKNLSAIKCNNCIAKKNINELEQEWSLYKYKVLEKSQKDYDDIRELLKDKNKYPAIEFYNLVERSLIKTNTENDINALLHVWGYFKNIASTKEKEYFKNKLTKLNENQVTIEHLKRYLWKLSIQYEIEYLLQSYYFYL